MDCAGERVEPFSPGTKRGRIMKACLVLAWMIGWSAVAWADGAVVPMRTPAQADISVYEPGQKALIGWNGTCEVLILSTDVSAQEETKALRIVPLPSFHQVGKKGCFSRC